MSYANGMYEVRVIDGGDFTTTGDKGDWNPGLHPYVIRGVAVLYETEPTGALVLKLDKIDGAGTRGDGDVAVLTGAAADDIRDVLYKQNLAHKVIPGERVVFEVTTASAGATACSVSILVEPSWDAPGNNSKMNASST